MDAMTAGGVATVVLNAANEVAVEAFLQKKIRFTDIPILLEELLGKSVNKNLASIGAVLEQDQLARAAAQQWVFDRSGAGL